MSNSFQVGDIVDGKVTQIKPFGAFVQLNETTRGLVHISQISHEYVKEISDVLKEGDEVKVKITAIENDGRKIALSIKDALSKNSENEKKDSSEVSENTDVNTILHNKTPHTSSAFEDMMKEFNKQSNERHADINKRLKR